jgi:hypothetical protein
MIASEKAGHCVGITCSASEPAATLIPAADITSQLSAAVPPDVP